MDAPIITGRAAEALNCALDAMLGACAGALYLLALAHMGAADLPPMWLCVAIGTLAGLVSRMMRRMANG